MTTGMLVESLMNGTNSYGGFGSSVGYDVLTESEAANYTLESGAALIARESRAELHEIFEMAIIQANEAIVGAKLEGYGDVMESATYGPVFEEAEKTVGKKVLEFLSKLKDKVVAFFQNLFSRLSEFMHNYEKFLKTHGADLDKAKSMKLYCIAWDDSAIDGASAVVGKGTDAEFAAATKLVQDTIKTFIAAGNSEGDMKAAVSAFENQLSDGTSTLLKMLGLSGSTSSDMASLNKQMSEKFRKPDKQAKDISPALVRSRLTDVKKHTDELRNLSKRMNSQYKDVLKKVRSMLDDIDKANKKGCSQMINRYASALSKNQTIVNAYISAAIRASISRANEAQAMAKALISGRPGGFTTD